MGFGRVGGLGWRGAGVWRRLAWREEGFGCGEAQGAGQGTQEAAEPGGFLAEDEPDVVLGH